MQTLKLNPDFFSSLQPGDIMADVRVGRRHIDLGEITFEATDGSRSLTAEVFEVRHKRIKDLDEIELAMRGQENYQEVIEGLRPFYPGLDAQTEVTVILVEVPE